MKKYKILLAAAALVGLSSCIEETLPTEYVLNDQIQASESALEGMVTLFILRWADIRMRTAV